MKKRLKKLKQDLYLIAKENHYAFLLAVVITIFSILTANLLYRQKPIFKRGYQIEIGEDGKVVAKKVEKPIDLGQLMKIADYDRGAKIFKKCASCHNIIKGEGAKVGPNLYQVVGRARASSFGFAYSEAIKAKGGAWDRDSINQFITKPKDYLPGTKMAFPGLKKPQDRADVILYLDKQGK
jgi:cytochrome c